MTKQEAIVKGYIDLIGEDQYQEIKEFINEQGWCKMMSHTPGVPNNHKPLMEFGISQDTYWSDMQQFDGGYWRPKNLDGIDDNNGWISNKTPPDRHCNCVVLRENDEVEVMTYYKGLGGWVDAQHSLNKNKITHYIIINLPQNRPLHD